jgi:hypothetical protein
MSCHHPFASARAFWVLLVSGLIFVILHVHAMAASRQGQETGRAQQQLPARAARFRPWGDVKTYRLAVEEARPVGRRQSTGEPAAPMAVPWRPWFDGAILFETDQGWRLVPVGNPPQGATVDYVEIRRTGNGFGVNSDNDSSKSHLYLDRFRFTRSESSPTNAGRVEFDATLDYMGPAKKPDESAHLVLQAFPLDGKPPQQAVPIAPACGSPAVAEASDHPTTITVTEAGETTPTRRALRRGRR